LRKGKQTERKIIRRSAAAAGGVSARLSGRVTLFGVQSLLAVGGGFSKNRIQQNWQGVFKGFSLFD